MCIILFNISSCTQGTMTYEIDEAYPSQSFFRIVPQANGVGQIRLTRDLREDSLQLSSYQVIPVT